MYDATLDGPGETTARPRAHRRQSRRTVCFNRPHGHALRRAGVIPSFKYFDYFDVRASGDGILRRALAVIRAPARERRLRRWCEDMGRAKRGHARGEL